MVEDTRAERAVDPKTKASDDHETAKKLFADIDELESRHVGGPESNLYQCNSGGFDQGVRWGGCYGEIGAINRREWELSGDLGSKVERSFKQDKSQVKDDAWSKKEVVYSDKEEGPIATRNTEHGKNGSMKTELIFESLGHAYSATTIDGKPAGLKQLPDGANKRAAAVNPKDAIELTDKNDVEYRAAMSKASQMQSEIETHPGKAFDVEKTQSEIAGKLAAGMTRAAAEQLKDALVTVYRSREGDNAVPEFLQGVADKSAHNKGGAKLVLEGKFDPDWHRFSGDTRIDPPASERNSQPSFVIPQVYDGIADIAEKQIAKQAHLPKDERPDSKDIAAYVDKLTSTNRLTSLTIIPGEVLELPKK